MVVERHGRRLRWTIGSLMILVAASAIGLVLVRPFAKSAPRLGEVIGIDFTVQEARLPDGRSVAGYAPKIVVTRAAEAGARSPKP